MTAARRFVVVSPNFHPRTCGVGDFSVRLSAEMGRRGHEVMVVSREPCSAHPAAPEVAVRGVGGRLPITIALHARSVIETYRPTDVVIQYTPQIWDASRFGTAAPTLLASALRAAGARVSLIAHELYIPFLRRPDLLVGAATQRLAFATLVKACHRTFVTTGTRASDIHRLCATLGVPSPGIVRVGANALPGARTVGAGARLGIFSTAAVGKRFDVVLDAFARINQALPAAELVLIGDLGPPDRPIVRRITDAISAHPARSRIRLTRKLSLAQISEEIANLDIYLFPMDSGANTRSGTLPTALGSGLPVVAVRAHETDLDLFRDGDNVVFAPELTGPAFAEVALRLLRDQALMTRLGQGARRLYDEHLSWERITDRFLAES
jgi:glycosyltransferase involved in cell wall biosynthesis